MRYDGAIHNFHCMSQLISYISKFYRSYIDCQIPTTCENVSRKALLVQTQCSVQMCTIYDISINIIPQISGTTS